MSPICLEPGCPALVPRGRCQAHQKPDIRQNADVRTLYHTPQWQALKQQVRAEEPWCRACLAAGVTVPGTQTDHIEPHRGSLALFWDRDNLQNLCAECHARKTRQGL